MYLHRGTVKKNLIKGVIKEAQEKRSMEGIYALGVDEGGRERTPILSYGACH